MQELYILAAVLAFITPVGHSWLGEKHLVGPLLSAEPLPPVLRPAINRRLVRWVWHLPSAIWAVLGLYILWAAVAGAMTQSISVVLGVVFAISGLANMGATRRVHFGWVLLFAIAACLWLGAFGLSPA